MRSYLVSTVSEDTVLATWVLDEGALPGPELAALLGQLSNYLLREYGEVVLNVVPAYRSLLIQYDLQRLAQHDVERLVATGLELSAGTDHQLCGATHTLPVWYDPRVAPDLPSTCHDTGLAAEELIKLHTAQTYHVYAVGFQPGFAYLGYVDERIARPRKSSFRARVPAGSVGIADQQTAIYPAESPGGWQLIGRAPIPALRDYLASVQVGDRVRFEPVSEAVFIELGGSLEQVE